MPAISELAKDVLPLVDANLRTSALSKRIFTGRLLVLEGEREVVSPDDPEFVSRVVPEMGRLVTRFLDNRIVHAAIPRTVKKLMGDLSSVEQSDLSINLINTLRINGNVAKGRQAAAIIP